MTFDPQRNVARCYPDGTHRSGNSESRRVGLSSPANRDWGSVFAARLGGARPARVRLGAVRQGDAWNLARSGLASQGEARRGRARQGEARIKSRLAPARLGWVRQGVARSGKARGATLYTHTSSIRYNSMSA